MIVQDVNNYFEVAVAAPIERTLTYLSPEESENELLPGMRVLVPLGGRRVTGYILQKVDAGPSGQQIKRIQEVLDSEPLFPAEEIVFFTEFLID